MKTELVHPERKDSDVIGKIVFNRTGEPHRVGAVTVAFLAGAALGVASSKRIRTVVERQFGGVRLPKPARSL